MPASHCVLPPKSLILVFEERTSPLFHMILTVRSLRARGLSDFAMVHDSYAVHAADVDVMNCVLRDEFVRVHESFRLEDLAVHARLSVPGIPIPPPPAAGGLDIQEVLKSQ